MKLAGNIDRYTAHEALYKSVAAEGGVCHGVLVRPDKLVSVEASDTEPVLVAMTEEEALDRLLWIKPNNDDELPGGFVTVKWGQAENEIRGFFYDEYDELDETTTGRKKFHGLLASGSDITLDADDVWVSPFAEGGEQLRRIVYYVDCTEEDGNGFKEILKGFYHKNKNGLLEELSDSHHVLSPINVEVSLLIPCPQEGELIEESVMYELEPIGFEFRERYEGVYKTVSVPYDIEYALDRWPDE